jgi:crotonobetainyl-CoA:carnitine CoA-transferase CaiB-like acyl-CoA transferase
MLRAVGLKALIEHPRFKTAEAITDNRDVYIALVLDVFLGPTTDEALQKLQGQGVPYATCLSLDEVLSQQQRVANESLATLDHPSMGFMRVMKARLDSVVRCSRWVWRLDCQLVERWFESCRPGLSCLIFILLSCSMPSI